MEGSAVVVESPAELVVDVVEDSPVLGTSTGSWSVVDTMRGNCSENVVRDKYPSCAGVASKFADAVIVMETSSGSSPSSSSSSSSSS
jgi:hypothetical protein